MGFLFGKTAQGTYVMIAFWIACYYFFSTFLPWDGTAPGLGGWQMSLLMGFLLIVVNMISVYLFIKVAGNRPWEWFEDGTYGPGDEG